MGTPQIRDLYEQAYDRRKHQIDKIWETIKFSTTIISGISTATILLFVNTNSWIVGILPLLGAGIGVATLFIIRRQYDRFLDLLILINKIEKVAGFHIEVPEDQRFYKNEKHLVPDKWLKSFDTSGEFKKENLSLLRKNNMYSNFSWLIIIISGVSLALSSIIFKLG